MAANEERTALWRTPLSTPARTNENGCQDLFRHSEKLLASALSICRLKGSVECQIGGLITVCEEMQRLLRLSFYESKRLETELKKQQVTYDDDISMLKERIAFLEEVNGMSRPCQNTTANKTDERSPLKPYNNDNIIQDVDGQSKEADKPIVNNTPTSKINTRKLVKKTPESNLPNNTSDDNQNVEELNISEEKEQLKPNKDGSKSRGDLAEIDSDDLSVEVLVDTSKASKTKAKRKSPSAKNPADTDTTKGRKPSRRKPDASERSKSGNPKEKEHQSTTESKTETNCSNSNPLEENESDVHLFNVDCADVDVANSSVSSDVYLNPESGLLEVIDSSEMEIDQEEEQPPKAATKQKASKEKKKSDSENRKKKKDNTKAKKDAKKLKPQLKLKKHKESVEVPESGDVDLIPDSPNSGLSKSLHKSIPESPVRAAEVIETTSPGGRASKVVEEISPGSRASTAVEETATAKVIKATAVQSNASLPKTTPQDIVNEEDEMLGDMSFLIDISSMISSFVSEPELSQQLELPLMEARKRADARKLAGLFNLHISIGSKSENRSSLVLSRTPNTKMPKPGKLDNLLSKLSIAAAKEAERMASKARSTKRKLTTFDDGGSFDDEFDSQTRRNTKSLSRSKKVRI